MKFEIVGTTLEKGKEQRFTKFLEAENEKMAREKLFSLMGSKHKIKRRHITIETAKGAKPAEGPETKPGKRKKAG